MPLTPLTPRAPLAAAAVALALALGTASCAASLRPSSSGATASHDGAAASAVLLAGNIETGYASLAPGRTRDPGVLEFAARLRTDHGAMNAELAELVATLGLTVRDDSLARALRDGSAARRPALERASGRAFDIAYLDADIASHRELVVLLDQLLSAPLHPALREHLTALRPVVTAHLAHAELLRATRR